MPYGDGERARARCGASAPRKNFPHEDPVQVSQPYRNKVRERTGENAKIILPYSLKKPRDIKLSLSLRI